MPPRLPPDAAAAASEDAANLAQALAAATGGASLALRGLSAVLAGPAPKPVEVESAIAALQQALSAQSAAARLLLRHAEGQGAVVDAPCRSAPR